MTLIQILRSGRFEFSLSVGQVVYYWLERKICHLIMRRPPPTVVGPQLLNLGCGPHIFSGWVNADDYALKRQLREKAFQPNWRLDITRPWLCSDDSWDGVFTEHVLEHVTYSEAVAVLDEAFRTLKPGAWIRISVPDLRVYVAYYCGSRTGGLGEYPHPAVAVSYLTQMHLHRSAWDGDLMVKVLEGIGFVDANVISFGQGSDERLIRDDPDKTHESLYVEARKPKAGS